jgi:hypothetical protein
VDGVGVQLVQLAELSEAALDDEAQPKQQVLALLGGGKASEAID